METNEKKSEFISEIMEKLKVYTEGEKLKDKGFILLAYDKNEDGNTQNAFLGAGHPADMAECFCGCMKQNQTLANISLAASTAFMHGRAQEEAAKMSAPTPGKEKETKRKRTKKPIN